MTKTRAVIHVICSEQCTEDFLQQIIVFVSRFRTTIDGHRVGAIAFINFDKFIGCYVEGSVPIGFHPIPEIRYLRVRDRLSVLTNSKYLLSSRGFWFSHKQISPHQRSRDTFWMI